MIKRFICEDENNIYVVICDEKIQIQQKKY
jgi:hypothetical protein